MRVSLILALFALFLQPLLAEDDPGKDSIGQLKVSLIYGGSSDGVGTAVSAETVARLRKSEALSFSSYRLIGEDVQNVLRSYSMWARPLTSDDQLMVSFEPIGRPVDGTVRMDLELWQLKKKILKTDPQLAVGTPLYILGPMWRDGRIIIAVELLSLD